MKALKKKKEQKKEENDLRMKVTSTQVWDTYWTEEGTEQAGSKSASRRGSNKGSKSASRRGSNKSEINVLEGEMSIKST